MPISLDAGAAASTARHCWPAWSAAQDWILQMQEEQRGSHPCGLSEIFSNLHPDEKSRGLSLQRRLSNV